MTARLMLTALLLVVFLATAASAQQQQQSQPPPASPPQQQSPPTPARPSDDSQESSSKTHNIQPNKDDDKAGIPPDKETKDSKNAKDAKDSKNAKNANYNPYPAEQDVEVGTFYLHKGDVDAAIDRFKDAIEQRPNFAKPRLLLAECYEKKGDKSEALKYYKEYLTVFPHAPDANKVEKKIEKLSSEQ